MSVEMPEPVAQETESVEPVGGNPAWKPFLDVLPTAFHSQVEPVLRDWDAGVNRKFQEIHDQYAPYKQFKDQGIDPETLMYGQQLMDLLDSDPQKLYEALSQLPGITPAQAQQMTEDAVAESDYSEEEPLDPRIAQLEQGVQTMAQFLAAQVEQEEARTQDAQLEQELAAAKEAYGDYDMDYVLQYAYTNDATIEQSVQAYKNFEQQILANSNRPKAPVILGNGGGVPSTAVNPSQLSDQERRALAVQMLTQAKQQR